jgi:hypothetical protein
MDDMDELAKIDLVKLALPGHINDAVGYLLREISRVGTLGGISYEEGKADGICVGLRLAGALNNEQEQALKMTLSRAIGRKQRELRPS